MVKTLSIRNPIFRRIWLSGALLVIAALLPFVAGCDDEDPVVVVDDTPPFPPDGVFSVTGDDVVTIYWNANWEDDLAGYAVFRNDQPDGLYSHVSDVAADQTWYDDFDVINGETWFYAVLAFDEDNNESDLSYELVFDTPRPEGFDLVLNNFMGQSALSGYDFSSLTGTAQPFDSPSTDIYFGVENNVNTIFTTSGVDIQDYGWFELESVDWAPDDGWAPSGRAEAIIGHSYVVQVAVPGNPGLYNYAKFEVTAVSPTFVRMDWAYQPSRTEYGNRELAPGATTGGASK
jgi:hypothetical protein